jgi:RNA polymerase sigma-70 factor, ECF subfamily
VQLRLQLLLHRLLLQLLLPATGCLQQCRTGTNTAGKLLLAMTQVRRNPETEAIWRTLSDRLRQFIRAHVGSAADVDDILQSAFLRIHQNVNRLRDTDRLEPWVFQIVRNAIADHYRKARPDSLAGDVEASPMAESTPHDLNGEVADCLGKLIDELPDHLQRAVQLYEQDGISQQEIADLETISLSGAKSRVQRGRRMLRRLLETCCQIELDRRGNVLEWARNASAISSGDECKCNSCHS